MQMTEEIIDNMDMSNAEKTRTKQTLRQCEDAVRGFEDALQGKEPETSAKDIGGVAGERLQSFIQRVERLEEEKAALMEDIKEVYAEAKGVGFCPKTMKKLVRLRKMDAEKRDEEVAILELYAQAIGMQGILPL